MLTVQQEEDGTPWSLSVRLYTVNTSFQCHYSDGMTSACVYGASISIVPDRTENVARHI